MDLELKTHGLEHEKTRVRMGPSFSPHYFQHLGRERMRRLFRFPLHVRCNSHCNKLQYTAISTATHTATHCNTLQHTATHCDTLRHTATHCNTLRHTATYCDTLQHTATHYTTYVGCGTLQHIAAHCNTLYSGANGLVASFFSPFACTLHHTLQHTL